MERVTFLIEESGERIACMLNPQSVVVRRAAGIRSRHSTGGPLSGGDTNDDPVLFTGGGRTEIVLELLFDVTLSGSSIRARDVRQLTGPLVRLTENRQEGEWRQHPPVVRFVWGKAWNVPTVAEAIAERFEHFDPGGRPRRSWLSLRLRRISERVPAAPEAAPLSLDSLPAVSLPGSSGGREPEREDTIVATEGERLEEIATRTCGSPSFWRLIAAYNRIVNPLAIEAGMHIRIPPLERQA
ncbi:MAG: CIS tube protein [Planctomycetota bacterium]